MEQFVCPLCQSGDSCKKELDGDNGFISFSCETFQSCFLLADEIVYMTDNTLKEKLLNLAAEQIIHHPYCVKHNTNDKWHFFYEPDYQKKDSDLAMYVNLADYIINYPDTVIDCANRVLNNLSIVYPLYGDEIVFDPHFHRLLFGKTGIFDILQDLGFVKQGLHGYIITADGWKRIDELKKKEIVLKQGFIAMWFDKSTTSIREAFREAIRESGYNERVIDEKEHNNQIVPEILFEIERSKFMVVDITYPNYGAYYEAGYAQALGKEVIICCRKDTFESKDIKPHFDIAQKSMIIWETEEELKERLIKRIEATVR